MGQPPPEFLEAVQEGADFELWPENIVPLTAFVRVQTQWRAGSSGPIGLDYHGVMIALRMLRIERTQELFEDIQAMERAALRAWAEARK